MPSPLVLESPTPTDAAATCNVLFALLSQRQRDMDARSSAVEVQRRLTADVSRAEAAASRARAAADASRDEAAAAQRREHAAALAHAGALAKLSAERDGAVRERAALSFKLSQACNDTRRREKERDALAEKLRALLVDGGAAKGRGKVSIVMAGPPRTAAGGGATPPDGAPAAVARALVQGLRTQLSTAMEENASLRASLAALHGGLRSLRAAVRVPPPPPPCDGGDDIDAAADEADEEEAMCSDDERALADLCAADVGGAGAQAARDPSALPFHIGGPALVARVRRDVRALRLWALGVAAVSRANDEADSAAAAARAAAATVQTRGDALIQFGGAEEAVPPSKPGSQRGSGDGAAAPKGGRPFTGRDANAPPQASPPL
jgi:hypothetical protein